MTQADIARIVEKGNVGEEKIVTWFMENGINFFQLKQSLETFAPLFSKGIKRPDFVVIIESIGLIAVDAKNCKMSGGCFTISEDEVQKAIAFEMVTRMAFWFAYLHETPEGATWYWISALNILGVGTRRINSTTNQDFFAINLSEFTAMREHGDIGKLLYTQRLRSCPK